MKKTLKDYPKFQKRLYCRGFLITNEKQNVNLEYPFYANWKEETIGYSFYMYTHKETYAYTYERNQVIYFIIGHAYDPYNMLVDENEILKKLTASCEQSGFIELERSQETSGKRNSAIYAYYLLAYMTSFVWIGLILMCITGTVMIAAGNEMTGVALPMLGAFGIMALLGYIPYDGLNSRTKRRQEDLNREFPDAVSKITLLVAAGNMTRAIEQTAQSGNSLIYQELRLVVKEMDRSSTLQGAFMRMQGRCSNKYLDKMITVVSKSYASGNANLADDLKTINDECWLDKKHNARRMSEAVQNKLFIPTMLMFIGILVVIVVPAMAGFNL